MSSAFLSGLSVVVEEALCIPLNDQEEKGRKGRERDTKSSRCELDPVKVVSAGSRWRLSSFLLRP